MNVGVGTLGFDGITEIIEPTLSLESTLSDGLDNQVGFFLYIEFEPYENEPMEVQI